MVGAVSFGNFCIHRHFRFTGQMAYGIAEHVVDVLSYKRYA